MKTVIQDYRNGELAIAEVPEPTLKAGGVLVRNIASLVSAGTERQVMNLAQKGLIGKARQRPDLVRKAIQKMRTDGVMATVKAINSRLDSPFPMGYSSAGVVLEVAEGVPEFRPGDAVACAGSGYACHAEIVFVPKNLCAKIPYMLFNRRPEAHPEIYKQFPKDTSIFEEAAFTTLGAIAMHGVRLAKLQLRETVAVIGLGLIGLLAAQMAKAAGCRVVGMDPDHGRCRLAESLGCDRAVPDEETFARVCFDMSMGHGVDRVLICASTASNRPVELAGEIARDCASVVAIGAVGLQIPRETYYAKELTFQVSRSYGPGRYDPEYEERGCDYPIGHVRWTENRNMRAFLDLLAQGSILIAPLITHRFPIQEGLKAYELITAKEQGPFLGVMITYGQGVDEEASQLQSKRTALETPGPRHTSPPLKSGTRPMKVGVIGAGAYATNILLPVMRRIAGIELAGLCTATGVKAKHAAGKFGFKYCTTDESEIVNDPEIGAVVVLTRHNLHARQVVAAIKAGKHVFVEKPLCLNKTELEEIRAALECARIGSNSPPGLMVGYNRRFAPMAKQLANVVREVREPLVAHYRVNAGYIPPEHWVQDPEEGGGRIIGEVCHFVDFLTFIAGTLPVRVYARHLPNGKKYRNDNVILDIDFENGSLGTVTYVANGDKSFPKERVEVFAGGMTAVLDNFRCLDWFHQGRRNRLKSFFVQDKGQKGEWEAFVRYLYDPLEPVIPYKELESTSLVTFLAAESLTSGQPLSLS